MRKKIFVVEDHAEQRRAVRTALTDWGFEVYTAKTVAEARKIADCQWKELDVAVLDMRLEDPEEPHMTGADIAIKYSKENETSPECIIFSAYAEPEYYKLAMELGAVSYLDKAKFNIFDLIHHVKAVALRKALSIENQETIRKIIRIITHSSDRMHAVKMFCQKVFAPELKICLGTPFFLILSSDKHSELCAGNVNLPKISNKIYRTLQSIAQAEASNAEPIPLDLNRLYNETQTETPGEYKMLEGATLLPIFNNKEHQISITLVLLKEEEIDLSNLEEDEEVIPPYKLTEDPVELWKVLNQYLKPTVVEHLLTIFSEWNHIKTTLREISQICIWIGQEQSAILRKSTAMEDQVVEKLRAMANDLAESGNLLRHIEKPLDETAEYPSLSAKNLVNEIWETIKLAENLKDEIKLEIDSDCQIEAQENDLYVIFSRTLQWFVKRRISTPTEVEPVIKVLCRADENESTITFTDKSNRLSETIRKELFVPFTQSITIPFSDLPEKNEESRLPGQYLPLYIAKMLVEVKYGGELVDATGELEGTSGNQFVLRFTKEPFGDRQILSSEV